VDQVANDDDDHWVEEFEARYADIERMPTKEKHEKAQPKFGTKSKGTPPVAPKRTLTETKTEHAPTASAPLRPVGRTAGDAANLRGAAADRECNMMEVVYPEGTEILATNAAVPKFTTLKVALDSGAGVHVINRQDAPGCKVTPSAMSRAGAAFLAADGGRIANHGALTVNMVATDSAGAKHQISSRFEAADVTRALWSVGLICDSGLAVQFSAEKATVADQAGNEICVFERCNGLYVAEVQIENPMAEDFTRPGM